MKRWPDCALAIAFTAGVAFVIAATRAAFSADAEPGVRILGETKYEPYKLVRLRAAGVGEKDAVLWRVYPSQKVQRATTPRGLLEFVAPPGQYEVELLAIRQTDQGLDVTEAHATVIIAAPEQKPEPKPESKPESKPEPKPDPANALVKVSFGNAFCTATIVGPRRKDGRWDILSAAHCLRGVGAEGTMRLKDGRTFRIRCVVHQPDPDLAWLITDESIPDLPFAVLAADNPPVGTAIWHAGYGVDNPGNREEGTVASGEDSRGQIRMILSVSSGDSGGGIFRADTNELVSTVCCTSRLAQKVSMWGASTRAIRAARPKDSLPFGEEIPVPLPIREPEIRRLSDDFPPQPMPIRLRTIPDVLGAR